MAAAVTAAVPWDGGGGGLGFGVVDVEVGVGRGTVDAGGCWTGGDLGGVVCFAVLGEVPVNWAICS